MIDLQHETLIPFSEKSQVAPGQPHVSTLHRWRQRGIRGVRLETCLIGGRRFTSLEAIQRFSEALMALELGVCDSAPVAQPRARQREIERAEQELNGRLGMHTRKA